MAEHPKSSLAAGVRGLRAVFDPPVFDETDRGRRARLLYRILVVASPVLLLLTVAALLGDSPIAHITYPLQGLVVGLVLVLLRRGQVTPATVLFLFSVWGLSSVTIIEEGGVGSPAMGSYALAVLMAGFFWSFRGALCLATLSIGATGVLLWAPDWVGLPAPVRSDPWRTLAETAAQLLVTAFLLQYALEFIAHAARERHRAQLAEARAKLLLEQRLRETQKFEAIGRLAGGVAHDFRNLLTVLLGELSLAELQHPKVDLRAMREATHRAERLASQLLAVGRQQELKPRACELNAWIEASASMLRSVAGPALRLELELADEECWVTADPEQLERVLMNLVANARDATGGTGTVRIETRAELSECAITVIDRGEGMSPETQSRVFEPFFSTKGETGTGLGLATAHGIVLQSGGHMEVDSSPGRGTRMHVFLPRLQHAHVQPEQGAA